MDWERRFEEAKQEFQDDHYQLVQNDVELMSKATVKFAELPSIINEAAILRCISAFTEAELDAVTPGERGLGRLSAVVPRYGAYFRKGLVRLSPQNVEALRQRIVAQLVAGYHSHVLLGEPDLLRSTAPDEESLFKKWVPVIYSLAFRNSFAQEDFEALEVLTTASVARHRELLASLGLKGGGFFSRDKSGLILSHFSLAGFSLRAMETQRQKTKNEAF